MVSCSGQHRVCSAEGRVASSLSIKAGVPALTVETRLFGHATTTLFNVADDGSFDDDFASGAALTLSDSL